MDVWILSFNDDDADAPYFPHMFSHKHGVVFADRQTAEKQRDALVADMFGTNWRTVVTKDNQVVIEGTRDGFGGVKWNGWVMIELHGVWGAAKPETPQAPEPMTERKAPVAEDRETYRFKNASDGGYKVFRVSDGKELGVITNNYQHGANYFTFSGAPRHYGRRKDAAAMMDALSRAREDAQGYMPGDQIAWALRTGAVSGIRLSIIVSIENDGFLLEGRPDPVTLIHLAYAKYGAFTYTLPKYTA